MTRGAALLILALGACAPPPTTEELRHGAYADLRKGDLESALARAREGRQRAHGDRAAERAFDVLEAEVLASRQRNIEALALLDPLLGGAAASDVSAIRARMTRGLVRCRARTPAELAAGEADLDEAAQQAAALPSAELEAEVALRQGTCRLYQGQWSAAEALFREALAVSRRLDLPFLEANAAGSLGATRIAAGQYDAATDWLSRALEVATRVGAETARVKTINNLGWCYFRLGDYERALPLLMEAERRAAERGLAGDRVSALTNIGNIHFLQGDHGRAAEFYERASHMAGELGKKWDAAVLIGNLGEVALEAGRHEQAEAAVASALRVMEELGDAAEVRRLRLAQGDVRLGRGDLAGAEALYGGVVSAARAEPELLWQGHAALGRLHARAGRPSRAEDEFRRAFAVIEARRSALREAEQRITFFASLRRFYDDYVQFLVDQQRPEEALEVAERSRARLLRERLSGQELPVQAGAGDFRKTAQALDATLLSYWTGTGRSLLWVVTAAGVRIHRLPDEAALRRDVEGHQRQVLLSRDPRAERPEEGQRLWRALLAPAGPAIGPGSRVLLVPDGPLHQLNFETLPVPGDPFRYWIEDVTVASAPSLSLIAARPAGQGAARTLLAIGDPLPAGDRFPRLAHAAKEVRGVAEGFGAGRTTVRTGRDAVPSAYLGARPATFGFVHFAAHVTANHESPLDSAIVLSPRDDGHKLYARDIVGVPLKAELVTLSACRSAGARAFAGEGLVGLSWSFLSAGAENVIGGLWNVEDASSAELMVELYRGLGRGGDPAAALREAKLRLLRSDTAYRKPFYWAPFVIYTRSPAARR